MEQLEPGTRVRFRPMPLREGVIVESHATHPTMRRVRWDAMDVTTRERLTDLEPTDG